MGEMPSEEVFLRVPSPYLCEFRRKPQKISKGYVLQARLGIESVTFCLPVLKRRTAQPLGGPRTDSFNFHPYPGFEPGTFNAAAGFPSHYTAWSAKSLVMFISSLIHTLISTMPVSYIQSEIAEFCDFLMNKF